MKRIICVKLKNFLVKFGISYERARTSKKEKNLPVQLDEGFFQIVFLVHSASLTVHNLAYTGRWCRGLTWESFQQWNPNLPPPRLPMSLMATSPIKLSNARYLSNLVMNLSYLSSPNYQSSTRAHHSLHSHHFELLSNFPSIVYSH